MYRAARRELDESTTNASARDDIEDIDVAYETMRDGENIRGVIAHAS